MSRKKSSRERPNMTRTSGSREWVIRIKAAIPIGCAVVWGLLAILLIGMSSSACVVAIPAEFQEEIGGDGGVNAYPIIKASTPAMPGPIPVNNSVRQTISLTLSDSDLRDTLYVRVFRDYSPTNTGFFDEMTIPNDVENGREDRQSLPADTQGWCTGLSGSHVFDAVVADRPFDTTPNALLPNRSTTGNGKSSTRSWVVQCVATP